MTFQEAMVLVLHDSYLGTDLLTGFMASHKLATNLNLCRIDNPFISNGGRQANCEHGQLVACSRLGLGPLAEHLELDVRWHISSSGKYLH